MGSEGPSTTCIDETAIYRAVLTIMIDRYFTIFEEGIHMWEDRRKASADLTLEGMTMLPKKAFDAEQQLFIRNMKEYLQEMKEMEEAKPLLRPEVAEALKAAKQGAKCLI